VQVDRLHVQAVQLREQLEAAALREEQVRLEAQAAAEERFDIALQQQQLKYERQIQVCMRTPLTHQVQQLLSDAHRLTLHVRMPLARSSVPNLPPGLHTFLLQELELANRYISTLDALLAGAPGSSFGRHLAASMAGAGSTERGSASASAAATAAAAAAAAAASDPATAGSLGGLYGSLGLASAALEAQIKRTLDGQAARAEAAEVSCHLVCTSFAWTSSSQQCVVVACTELVSDSQFAACRRQHSTEALCPAGRAHNPDMCLLPSLHRLTWRLRS
jgi:hypothetical protein